MRTLLALVAVLALLEAGAAAADGASVSRPEVRVGDRWTYRVTDLDSTRLLAVEVTFVGPDVIQAVGSLEGSDKPYDTTWTREWNAVNDRLEGSFFPHSGLLRFPLAPGVRYRAAYEVDRPRTRETFRAHNTIDVTVVGWEDVTVPAGTFRALHLEASGTFERLDVRMKGTLHTEAWYAPQVRRLVKRSFENRNARGRLLRRDSLELVGYQVQ